MTRSLFSATLWLSLCLILIIPNLAYGGFYNGNDLVEYMREHEKYERGQPYSDVKTAFFKGYIVGVYDATEFMYNTPGNVTAGQLTSIVTKYLNDHPEKWSESASNLVIQALKEAFNRHQGTSTPEKKNKKLSE